MLAEIYKEELPVLKAVNCCPSASVIIPFDPKMVLKKHIKQSLETVLAKIKQQLNAKYDKETAGEILGKFKEAFDNLDYSTHKKSIAVYISPVIQKVYYLNIPVVEKITVNGSFEIKDLVLNKKDTNEFLLVVISGKKENVYVGNRGKLTQIVSNKSAYMQRDMPERVGNFSDPQRVKEIRLENFLRYIDNGLSLILKAYSLPLFIMTTKKTMGLFKQLTKHNQYITGYIHGNFENAAEHELQAALTPQLANWKVVREKNVLNRLIVAENDYKLASGIDEVWKNANRKQGQLLVVEEDFHCPAFIDATGKMIFCSEGKKASETKDIVNDIMEKVLESGGDVEFVDELNKYHHIALIEYYHEN